MWARPQLQKALADKNDVFSFCSDCTKILVKQIVDLDDIRAAIAALNDLRENGIRIDGSLLGPIEQLYVLEDD